MKARLAKGLSASCVFFGLIVTLEYPVAVNCGTITCVNVVTFAGPLIMVAALIALTVMGLITRDGKII